MAMRRDRAAGCMLWGALGPGLVAVVFYWGWCWSWWGRDSLWLQAAFQCQCPRASEAARYRPFRVVVSACQRSFLRDVWPSGRSILVLEGDPAYPIRYDLATGARQVIELPGDPRFLGDMLIVLRSRDTYSVVDLSDGARIALPVLQFGTGPAFDPATLQALRDADQVILSVAPPRIVGVVPGHEQDPERNLAILTAGFPPKAIRALLEDEGIAYTEVPLLPEYLSLSLDTQLARASTLDAATSQALRDADRVMLPRDMGLVVALAYDFKRNPEKNVVIEEYSRKETRALLEDEGIAYSEVPAPYLQGPAPDHRRYALGGHLWADYRGLYLADTGHRIVATGQSPSDLPDAFGPEGWVLKDRAVVYGDGNYRYLINTDVFGDHFPVPQPILLLEVPPAYWATPSP